MSNLIPFESHSALPAFLQADAAEGGNLAAFGGSGYGVVSIKGKVFHLKRGEESTLITEPGKETPAPTIDVVILGISPVGNLSAKIYFPGTYVEGSTEKPTCYSNDGVSPAADAQQPQCSKCAICPRNVKGSKPTATNPQGRECSSSKRLAIATADNLEEAYLMRVPGGSVVPFSEYLSLLKNRNLPNSFGVVTRIGFDYSVAHPALTFKPIGFVDAGTYAKAKEVSQGDLVKQILDDSEGGSGAPQLENKAPAAEPVVQAPVAQKAPPTPAPAPAKPKAATKSFNAAAPAKAADDDLPTEPKATVRVEGSEAPAPKPEVKAVDSIEGGMSAALDDLDFDD